MKKTSIIYDSPVDALVAIAKGLALFESKHRISSEEFYNLFRNGQTDDSIDAMEWAADYQHYMALKIDLENKIQHAA